MTLYNNSEVVIQYSINQSKDYYAQLAINEKGIYYYRNNSDGYYSKQIV